MSADAQALRALEALLFAARAPLSEEALEARLPPSADIAALLAALADRYRGRGVEPVNIGGGWAFRTAPDLAHVLRQEAEVRRRLSRAALETLAIVAYRQPVTRAEIEAVRGVAASRGTLDILFDRGWIEPRGRRRAPGRPVTWATTPAFLDHFGLSSLDDLPDLDELRAAGLLDDDAPGEARLETADRAVREGE